MPTTTTIAYALATACTGGELRTALANASGLLRAGRFAAVALARDGTCVRDSAITGYSSAERSPTRLGGLALTADVRRHCAASATPVWWGDLSQYAVFGHNVRPMRLRRGLAVGLRVTATRRFALAFEWDGVELSTRQRELAAAAVQTFAVFAVDAAHRIWQIQRRLPPPDQRTMTPRQLECLYWASRGVPDRALAALMRITALDVRRELEQCAIKLGAATRVEAAVIASHLGLIDHHPTGRLPNVAG